MKKLPGLSGAYGVISLCRKTGAAPPEEAAAYIRTELAVQHP